MAHCAYWNREPNCAGVPNAIIQPGVIAAAFLLAGLVKGVTGLACPLSGSACSVWQCLLPGPQLSSSCRAFITNVWQMVSGHGVGRLVRRRGACGRDSQNPFAER